VGYAFLFSKRPSPPALPAVRDLRRGVIGFFPTTPFSSSSHFFLPSDNVPIPSHINLSQNSFSLDDEEPVPHFSFSSDLLSPRSTLLRKRERGFGKLFSFFLRTVTLPPPPRDFLSLPRHKAFLLRDLIRLFCFPSSAFCPPPKILFRGSGENYLFLLTEACITTFSPHFVKRPSFLFFFGRVARVQKMRNFLRQRA